MLEKIRIRRFKSIHDAELAFGRVNLFIAISASPEDLLIADRPLFGKKPECRIAITRRQLHRIGDITRKRRFQAQGLGEIVILER